MAKSILDYPIDKFENEIHKIGSKNLVGLIKGIYGFKWEYGERFNDNQIKDLERKQTKIEAELTRRGYINKQNIGEYYQMLRSINFKKRKF